jgi:aryl-alcohol dehydrogenase-like predicted oxidoreductase
MLRFSAEKFPKNPNLVNQIAKRTKKTRCIAGPFNFGVVDGKRNDTIPIPGTKKIKYLEENLGGVGSEIDRIGQCTDLKGDQRCKSQGVSFTRRR